MTQIESFIKNTTINILAVFIVVGIFIWLKLENKKQV